MDPLKRHTPTKTNRIADNLLVEKSPENRATISATLMIR
jgi:hypothetical protein